MSAANVADAAEVAGSPPGLGRPPVVLLVPALLGVALLLVPLVAMVAAADPAAVLAALGTEAVREALWLSVWTATVCMAVCLVLGLPLAWLLARVEFRGRGLLRAAVTVPLVLPPVVAGLALRMAFGRSGLLGEPVLGATGFGLPYTPYGVVLAVEGALRAGDPRYDAVAATLGATRWTTFRRVTLPLAGPGVVAGMVLGWSRSLGEFGATITFNGSFPGRTQTMPTLVYVTRQSDQDAALALSLVMLLVSLAVLVGLRDRWLGAP